MSHLFGCKQTPKTPPTTTDEESSGSTSDAEAKKKKGNRAMGKKKYPKAIKYYTKAIMADGTQATYRLNRAIANSALDLWKDAETDAAEAVRLGSPPTSKSHYQLARARLRRGNCEEARETVRAGLADYPAESALTQLAKEIDRACKALEAKRNAEEEAENAKPAATEGPSAARTLLDQARAAYNAGKADQAVTILADARRQTEAANKAGSAGARLDEIAVLSLLGKACMQLRRWPEAADAFQKVVELEEAHFSSENKEQVEALSNAYNNLGIARKNSGKMKEAAEALNKAYYRATNGDDKMATVQIGQILQNLANCLRTQKKLDEALMMFNRALEVGQRLFGDDHASQCLNHMCIGRCCRDNGDLKAAIVSYTKAIEIWQSKSMEQCVKETPELPNKDRLAQVQQQCRDELAQILYVAENARKAEADGEHAAQNSSSDTALGSTPAIAEEETRQSL